MSNTFNFEYDATTGVLIAAALREKADSEIREAHRLEDDHVMRGIGADQARNRARLLRKAAQEIHAPVQAAIAADMGEALRKAGVVE